MMKLRRRPLSVYNASPNSNSQNSVSHKRQRKTSNQSVLYHDENDSDVENRSPLLTSDGKIYRLLNFYNKLFLESDDDDRSSGIQTRSIAAAKRNNNQSSDNGMFLIKLICSDGY